MFSSVACCFRNRQLNQLNDGEGWEKQNILYRPKRLKKFMQNRVKTCKRWQAAHLHQRETFETFYILLHWGDLFQGSYSLKFERWYRFYIADQDTARYSLCSAREKLFKLSRTFRMFNRQFIQFARIPVDSEFVARLWDMSTQKYNNFSIAAVILE